MHEIDKVGITPDTACGLPGRERTVVVAGECPLSTALDRKVVVVVDPMIRIPPRDQILL